MYRFISLEEVEIKDRGLVHIVECPKDCTGFSWLLGMEVSINGKVHKVKGVESYAIPFIRKGTKIGLLI